jgi:hypothetical protein
VARPDLAHILGLVEYPNVLRYCNSHDEITGFYASLRQRLEALIPPGSPTGIVVIRLLNFKNHLEDRVNVGDLRSLLAASEYQYNIQGA